MEAGKDFLFEHEDAFAGTRKEGGGAATAGPCADHHGIESCGVARDHKREFKNGLARCTSVVCVWLCPGSPPAATFTLAPLLHKNHNLCTSLAESL